MDIVVNQICEKGATTTVMNTGGRLDPQCLEGLLKYTIRLKNGFSFPSLASLEDDVAIKAAIAAKNALVLYNVEVPENENVEPTYKELREGKIQLTKGNKGNKDTYHLGICGDEVIRSISMEYNQVMKVTELGEVLCVVKSDGTVWGLPIASYTVGIREDTISGDAPKTTVSTKYLEHKQSILKIGYADDLDGIHDLVFKQVGTSTATSISFTAKSCNGNETNSLVLANIRLETALGVEVTTVTSIVNTNGVYLLTGTGFAPGQKLGTNGVVIQPAKMYETPVKMTVV